MRYPPASQREAAEVRFSAVYLYNAGVEKKENEMKILHRTSFFAIQLSLFLGISLIAVNAAGQPQTMAAANPTRSTGRPVVIPVTIKLKESASETELQNIDLVVSEDGEPQTILSIRGRGTNSPITLAILIQED